MSNVDRDYSDICVILHKDPPVRFDGLTMTLRFVQVNDLTYMIYISWTKTDGSCDIQICGSDKWLHIPNKLPNGHVGNMAWHLLKQLKSI